MSLEGRFVRWVESVLVPWMLRKARRDPDVSLDEYRDIERLCSGRVSEMKANYKRRQSRHLHEETRP